MQIGKKENYRVSLLHLGFRPFFLLAGFAAVLLMLLWAGLFHGISINLLSPWTQQNWHGHEMIYGYALAVVAGFLLTAMRNWTNIQTLTGFPLLILAVLWLLPRFMAFVFPSVAPALVALFDLTFNFWLCIALFIPIAKSKQWKQLGIWALVCILTLNNVVFYLGILSVLEHGVRWGIYGGLYSVITLILVMGRRVIPFFIEKGAGRVVTPVNRQWADISALLLILIYFIAEVYSPYHELAAGIALVLAGLHGLILAGWYTPAIWQKPLLWVLYIGYAWIVLGFALRGLMLLTPIDPMLAVHAFAVGGIGMITIGMMSRVSLGHTGRDVSHPPAPLFWIFLLLLSAAIVRVLMAWWFSQFYLAWIGISQALWIIAFFIFIWIYLPILIKPRIDGTFG